jgi:hypothetical protein
MAAGVERPAGGPEFIIVEALSNLERLVDLGLRIGLTGKTGWHFGPFGLKLGRYWGP